MTTSSSASSPTPSRRGLPLQSISRRTSSTPRPATYQTSRPISRVAGPEPRTYVKANPQRLPRLPVNHGQRGIMKQQAQWQDWPDLIVKVKGLPLSIDTWQLFSTFEKHGNIVYVFLFDSNGQRDGTAMIKFSPPPLRAFWDENPYTVRFGNSSYSVYLYPEKPKSSSQIQSPIKPHIFYDQKMKLVGSTLQFGIMLQPNTIMPMQTLESDKRGNMTFVVDLFKKQVVVDFVISFRDPRNEGISDPSATHSVGFLDRDNRFKFEMPFGLLQCVYMIDLEDGKFALIITLNSPPRYFKKSTEIEKTHIPGNSTWNENDTWWRYTDIVYDPYRLRTRPVALPREKPVVDIGRWKTYRMIFRKAQNEERLIEQMKNALQDFNIEVKMLTDLHEEPEQPTPLWSLIDPPRHLHLKESEWSTDLKSLNNGEGAAFLPFDVRYQLEVCLSRDILNEHNITSRFVQRLAEMSRRDSNKARTILEYIVEQDKRVYDPMTIFDDPEALDYSPKTKIPYYCGYARKATVTPSTIIFSSPTVETTNRVTRHYSKENDDGRFLRVQFTDEHFEGRINSNADKGCDDEVYTRVYRTLVNGIQIGDRHYQFLAFGNSQFRENGAYFFCPTEHLSCDDIRRWMGNFKHIRIPAKYAARLGQCFSTTRAINGMSAPVIVKIPDIERTFQGHKYCFTDGVGKISKFLAQMIAAELGTNSQPSAFQFRLGGCKGILVVSSDAKDKEVHIRESQQKFSATYNGLEIIRCSRFSCASLNRQVITILSSLGVEDQVFLDMLSEQLSNYQKAISDNTLALELLGRYIDDNHMTLNIASMILNGFMTEKEPFVLSLLHLWRSWSIKLLKEKAKIIVEEGAFVLGCVDETGKLRGYTASKASDANQSRSFQEDELPQIFIQVPDKTDSTQYKVIEGICLIGRNPSLHPGDIRIVQAINVPALHHLRDVVVFPQTGDRDIPSMCSGGDLDGDDFFVIWDKKLRPKEWNNEPMNYLPPAPLELNRAVRVGDLIKFFVKFMKNDALPTIAHNHLAQSDYLTNGIKDRKCLELASLHSKAVDYVKTGQPAEMPQRLRIAKWPHFLEKKHKSKNKIYRSQKILGQLYDRVESVDFVPQYDQPFDKRILKAYKLESPILKSARQIKSKYDTAMRRIMAQQEIKTEFEVWTTFVLSKPRVGSDYKVQEDMEKITGALKARFQEVCIETAGSKDFSVLGPFVAAMYRVTKEEMDIALAECRTMKIAGGREVPKRKMEPRSMPLMSFPWLFEKELGRIATGIEASDELEDLGLFNITTKGKGQAHTRHGGAATEEDFIEMEDGGVVHRGEELDLFKPIRDSEDSDELSFDDDDFEDSHADHKYIMGKSGELMLDTSNYDPEAEGLQAPTKSKLTSTKRFDEDETAEEDIMPKTVLDGFINPRKTGETAPNLRRAPHNKYAVAKSHSIIQNDNQDQSNELATRNPSVFDMLSLDSSSMEDSDAPGDTPGDSPTGLTGSDSGRSSPNRLDHSYCSVTASGFDECMAKDEKEVIIDDKPSSLEKLARLYHVAEEEEEEEEEEAIIDEKLSSLEKLARLNDS